MPFGDRSFLQHVIDEACASRLDEVVVVLGARASDVRAAIEAHAESVEARACGGNTRGRADPRGLRFAVNEDFASGLSSSLKCGLRACDPGADAAAILLGDQPGVDAGLIDSVLDAFAATRAPMTRPVFVNDAGTEVPGHPAVLARAVWPEVEALRGDEGARALFARDRSRVHELRIAGEPPVDVDTPDDYRRALALGAATVEASMRKGS
jgi:molybdenum cofactor cytidylyltransferase